MAKSVLIILVSFFVFFQVSKAQDQLYKRDNSKILVKIQEVNPDEIKYKLYSNLNGPVLSEARNNVILIIYESGLHEVISPTLPEVPAQMNYPTGSMLTMSKNDSLAFYKYSKSLSINFANFMNNELGLMYQYENYKSNYSIVIPMAVGVEKPGVTQSIYFNGNTTPYNGSHYTLNKKLFEIGFGVNYYPSFRSNVNYYIGPVFKFMQYDGTQSYSTGLYNGQYVTSTQYKNSTLTRYTMSITNGVVIRTRSRLNANIFGSLGFKNDAVTASLVDQNSNTTIQAVGNAFSLYFWMGFNVGFCF